MEPEQPIPLARNRRCDPRRSPRRSATVECRLGTTGLGKNIALRVLDVSETGMRLVVQQPLEHGDRVEILLLAQGQARPLKVGATVVWIDAPDAVEHAIGLRFDRRLRYVDFQHLT